MAIIKVLRKRDLIRNTSLQRKLLDEINSFQQCASAAPREIAFSAGQGGVGTAAYRENFMSFDYAVVIAPDGRVLWINDGPEHPQSRTMGKRIWETVVPDQEQVVRSAFAECALTGRQTEVLAHCQNGPAFQMQFSRVNHAEMVLMLSRRTRLDVHLTAREIDVLRLICDDHTNDEIARRLRVKRTTVETHRSNIMAKLRCRTISGVVKTAVEYGLV